MEDLYKTEPAPIKPTVLRYALIGSLILIAFSLVSQLTGLTTHSSWAVRTSTSLVSIVIMFLVFRSAIISYRDQENEGLVTLGKGFMITFWITLIMAAVSTVFFIIMVTYIDSSVIDFAREEAITDMESKGMSDEEIDQAMGFAEFFMSPAFFAIAAFFATVFLGAIIGLVTAIIYKKEVPVKL
jgi:hypothetical protein